MRLTRITVRTVADDRAALIVDAIWAAARPEDRLEHVSVEVGSDAVAIGIFTGGDGPGTAEAAVRRLMERVCAMSTIVRSSNVGDVRDVPLAQQD